MILQPASRAKINIIGSLVMGVVGIGLLNLAAIDVDAAVDMSGFANQLTNPNDADMISGGEKGAIDLHLKNVEDIAEVPENNITVYFPKSVKKVNASTELKVTDGRKGRICNINGAKATGKVVVEISIAGGSKTTHAVDVDKVCNTNSGTPNSGKFFGATIKFPSGNLIVDNKLGLNKAEVLVKFNGDALKESELGGSDRYALNYNLKLSGSNSGKGKLAYSSVGKLGLRSSFHTRASSAGDRKVQAAIPFGFPCDRDPATLTRSERAIKLYDADGVFGDTFMWIEQGSSKLSKNDYDIQATDRIDTDAGDGGWIASLGAWKLKNSNLSNNTLAIKSGSINNQASYKVFVLNTGKDGNQQSVVTPHSNTLSLSIPFDSMYASKKCNYSLEPTVNPPANSTETYVENSIIPVTGRVTVDGFDTDNHDWSLSVRVFDNRPNDRAQRVNGNSPCSWGGGFKTCQDNFASGNRRFNEDFSVSRNFDSAGIDAGDWVCFMMSVKKPSYGAPNGRWKHSVIKCVGIRGDVSGTTVNPDRYSYYHDIDITSIADNLNDYPKIDTFAGEDYKRRYPWQIIEAKFTQMPTTSIGEATNDDACATIQSNFSSTLIAGSCRDDIGQGDDLFPNNNAKQTVTASSEKDTPDPIGTWTCYTMRYRNNPRPISALESDIDTYVADHNDDNSSSSSSRWSDGYSFEHYHDTSYIDPESGELVPDGFTHAHGSQISKSSIWNPYLAGTSPARYTYTSYERTSCSVAGIWPKVQIQAGDLRVAGDIAATATSIAPPAQYRGMYGSFGEYGVLSQSGLVTGMASGAGFNSGENLGSSQFDWSALTFSNNSGTEYGNSGIQAVHSFNYTNPIEIDGDLTVSSINDLYTPESRRHVYVVNGNVYITGNLAYSNNYNTTEQLPKIAIKANNIIVAPGVDRIDPWLIADDVLNTCGDITFDIEAASLADAGLVTTNAHNSACDNNGVPLVFNGPVIAGRVFLLRTTGSRDSFPASSADGKRTLSQPAEIFNLRPDAFLSSFSNNVTPNPVAVTDRVIDLPPRF